MAGGRRALISGDVIVRHTSEVVVGFVVLAYVVQAKMQILTLVPPTFWRTVGAGLATVAPLAYRPLIFFDRGVARLYSDAVEIFGVQIHDPIMVG